VAKKERDESAFVAEGEGARTDARAVCAGVGGCVCVCVPVDSAGLGWAWLGCRVAEKRREKKKNVPWARGAKASGWTFENGADVCWRPLGPCAEYGVLLAEFRRRGEVSVMADAGLVVYQTREWE
jgi:hypothetical protein